MNALHPVLAPVLADPLLAARRAASPLGYVGFDIPLDILCASGRIFCHLPWRSSGETRHADQWLEASFPPWARSMLEDWTRGEFDAFECVLFSRGDDAAQRLYYYICELQRLGSVGGPHPLIFDLALIPRASSLRHCAASIRDLLARLQISEQALAGGIDAANLRRGLYTRIDGERTVPGHVYEHIARADLYTDLYTTLRDCDLPVAGIGGRVLLAGSSPPDDRLHRAVEAAGWMVTGDAHARALARHGPVLESAGSDPVTALAGHLQRHSIGPRAFLDRAAWLLENARKARAQAVVLWLSREDEALAWHVAAQRQALAQAGIPALILTGRQWDGQDGAAGEITDYLRRLSP